MKTVYEPVYKCWVTAFIQEDEDKAKKTVEKIIGESLDDVAFNSQAKTIEYKSASGGQRIIMWFKRSELSLLAHELIHVIEFCFELRRIPFALNNAEVVAYYMEWLFTKFEPLFRVKKGKHD